MARAVIDSSVYIRGALTLEQSAEADRVLDHYDLLVIDQFRVEVANVLSRYARNGFIAREQAREILTLATDHFTFIDSAPYLKAALDLSMERRQSVYDCLYAVFAIEAHAPLATADKKLCVNLAGVEGLQLINLYDMPEQLP